MLRKSLTAFGSLLLGAACSPAERESVGSSAQALTQSQAGDYTEAGDEFGAALAAARFNHDGYGDLVVGAPGEDAGRGAVSVLMGGKGGPVPTIIKQSLMNVPGGDNAVGDRFGSAFAVGDLNGDTYDDLVVGIPGEDLGAGAVAVWRGGTNGLEAVGLGRLFTANDFGCGDNEPGDEFGFALAIGDFNLDGYGDLAVGAPGENDDAGWVCIVKGRATTGIASGGGAYYSIETVEPPNVSFDPADGHRFGAALATGILTGANMPGEVGFHHDLVIGAPGKDAGEALVLFGRGGSGTGPAAFFQSPGAVWLTPAERNDGLSVHGQDPQKEAGDHFGATLLVTNWNRDDYADVIVGAPDARTGLPAGPKVLAGNSIPGGAKGGAVFVFASSVEGTGPSRGHFYQQTGGVIRAGTEDGDRFGAALAAADFDNDGQVDIAVGSPGEGPGTKPETSGMLTLLPASKAGLEMGTPYAQEDLPESGNSEAGDLMGTALAVGNFNGDGFMDLAIGAPGEAPSTDPAGGYVFIRSGAPAATALTHGPILGAVTHDSIKVWVRANRQTQLRLAYTPPGQAEILLPGLYSTDPAADFTKVVTLSDLLPNTQYGYRVILGGETKYTGSFRTLPLSGALKFAYGADFKPLYRPFIAATRMEESQPHFVILGGDNIYADQFHSVPDAQDAFEGRYRQTFADGPLRSLMQKVPTFMIWDDHEIKNNFADTLDGNPAVFPDPYASALGAYKVYQGSHNPGNNSTVYYSFRASEVDFFVLDTRSYRAKDCIVGNTACTDNDAWCYPGTVQPECNPEVSVCDLCQTMLGKTQRDALLQWLLTSTGKFKIIVSSVPFDETIVPKAGGEEDAWRGFRAERKLIFDYIKTHQIGGVVLLSGDQHWAGIFRRDHRKDLNDNQPYLLNEFMATPTGVDTRPLPNEFPASSSSGPVVYSNGTQRGYGRFTFSSASGGTLTYEWVNETGSVMHIEPITRASISPW